MSLTLQWPLVLLLTIIKCHQLEVLTYPVHNTNSTVSRCREAMKAAALCIRGQELSHVWSRCRPLRWLCSLLPRLCLQPEEYNFLSKNDLNSDRVWWTFKKEYTNFVRVTRTGEKYYVGERKTLHDRFRCVGVTDNFYCLKCHPSFLLSVTFYCIELKAQAKYRWKYIEVK